MKDDRACLQHILDCLDAIRSYVAAGPSSFLGDRMTRKATLRELQELAESTQRLSPAGKARHPEVPWPAIAGFRNVLVHDYLGLSLDRIWAAIEHDLPPLRRAVEAMLRELGDSEPRTPGESTQSLGLCLRRFAEFHGASVRCVSL